MSEKPTGVIGAAILRGGPEGVTGSFEQLPFPTDKAEIERRVMVLWVEQLRNAGTEVLGYTQNPENDFDFTLDLADGSVSVDLVEFVYRDQKGPPYKGQNLKIRVGDAAEQLRDIVLTKSKHYGRASDRPIYLLVYATHWRFLPAGDVLVLAQHLLGNAEHIMRRVDLLVPIPVSAIHQVLFPSSNPLKGRDPSAVAQQVYQIASPDQMETQSEHRAIIVSFGE